MNLISVLSILAAASWLGVVAAIALLVSRVARGEGIRGRGSLIVITLVIALALNVLSTGLVFIEPTERGVVVSAIPGQQGVRNEALTPGLSWIVPFFDRVVTYPTVRQEYTMSIAATEGQRAGDDSVEARTSDGQVVLVDATVIFALNPTEVVTTHQQWQDAYTEGLVRPLTRGIIRDAVSTFGIEEVYSIERLTLTENIRAELARKLNNEGLLLIDFVLRNIAFSPEYAASVEQKQIAEQKAQEAAFVVQQREQEALQAFAVADGQAKSTIRIAEGAADSLLIQAQAEADARLIQAAAEAEALRLLGAALEEYPDVLLLQYIQKLAENITVMLLPSNNPFLLPLPELSGSSGFGSP
ncbi:MAG: prohibitin family protein [Anaerolineae bacterium]|nr:prohibitin family protein [Anaerolineae bacterium]